MQSTYLTYIYTGLISIVFYESIKYIKYYFQYKANIKYNPLYFILLILNKTSYGRKIINKKINDTKIQLINDLAIDNIENKFLTIPKNGLNETQIFNRLEDLINKDCDWKNGRAFGYVYHGGIKHNELLHKAYKKFSNTNPLHSSAFKSTRILESEVIRMTARMLYGNDRVCGCMTSGGTESIILAVKAAKDFFLNKHPNIKPEIVCYTGKMRRFCDRHHRQWPPIFSVPACKLFCKMQRITGTTSVPKNQSFAPILKYFRHLFRDAYRHIDHITILIVMTDEISCLLIRLSNVLFHLRKAIL